MKNDRLFLRCSICGNIIGMVEDAGPTVACCGQDMESLTPNTTDAAMEKHVPVATRYDGGIEVQVGSVLHPMTEEHHISWIAVAGDGWTQRTTLGHTKEPTAFFYTKDEGSVSVYEYCNLHGLWASEI